MGSALTCSLSNCKVPVFSDQFCIYHEALWQFGNLMHTSYSDFLLAVS